MGTFTSKIVELVRKVPIGIVQRNAGATIHVVVSIPLVALAVVLGVPWLLVAVVNGVSWLVREKTQTDKSFKDWSNHKHIEWIAPLVAGTIAAYVTNLII